MVVDIVDVVTVDEATRRMMGFLMDNALSRKYNFVGPHGKLEFRGLHLFEVVYGMFTFHEIRAAANSYLSTDVECNAQCDVIFMQSCPEPSMQ